MDGKLKNEQLATENKGYDNLTGDLKSYYSKYKEHLLTSKCISLNYGTFRKYYAREYGYFCFSCLDKEICEECFYNCHKDCDPSLKLIQKIKDYENTRFICPCNGDLFHSKRKVAQTNVDIAEQFSILGKLYNYLINPDSENSEEHSQEDFENLRKIIEILKDRSKLSLEILSKYGRKQDIFEIFNKFFEIAKPVINDYLMLFRAFQLLILKNHFQVDFREFKSLSLRDFQFSSLLDLLWYQKYLISKINEYKNVHDKYFTKEKEDIKSLNSECIKTYIRITLKFLEIMLKTFLSKDLETLAEILQIIYLNLNYLAVHLLLDYDDIILIFNFIFEISKVLNYDMTSFKIVDDPEKEVNTENLYSYPYQLSKLLYMCSKIYNMKILEDFINTGSSEKTFMFYNGDKTKENSEIKSTAIISYLKLIAQKENDINTRDQEVKMLNEVFFNPAFSINETLYSPLYFYYDTNDTKFKSDHYQKFADFNGDIYKNLDNYLFKLEELNKNQPEPKEEEKIKVKFNPFLQNEYNVLIKIFNDFENFIDYDSLFLKKKEYLYEVKDLNTKCKIFYDKDNKNIYVDEFKENAQEIILYFISEGLDHLAGRTISTIFTSFLPLKKEDESHLNEIENLLNKCLNILTLMSVNECGLESMKIGDTLDFLMEIILRQTEPEKINYMKENENYKNLFKKLYIFYSSLPFHIKKIYDLKINGKVLLNDSLLEIIPIYSEMYKFNQEQNITETVNLLDNYYNFMQIHKKEFDYVKIVEYIKTYYTEEKYKEIQLNSREFQLSESYFDLLQLISIQYSFYTDYNYQPEQSLFHILSIEKCAEMMNLPKLPINKKMILLKSMLLIASSPYKSWKARIATCLYPTLFNDDSDYIGGIFDKYIKLLDSEINKLNSSMIGNEDYKSYCKCLLDCIVYFSNFLYTQNVISSLNLRSYYLLYLDLKAVDPLLQKIILNIDTENKSLPKDFEDEDEYDILEKNDPNKVTFYYNSLYEKFYNLLKKYKDTIDSLISNTLFNNYFSNENKNLSFSNFDRYKLLFSSHTFEVILPNDIINDKNYIEMISNINKWRDFLLEKLNDNKNYILHKLFEPNYLQFLRFKYGVRDNYGLIIFCLLGINIHEGAIMILKNSQKIIENLILDDFKAIQGENQSYPIFIELLMNKLIYRLNLGFYTDLSIIKVFANTRVENRMFTIHLTLIKLFQSLIENHNTTFAYSIFIKKYISEIPYISFDKKFDFGFLDKIYEKDYFDKKKENTQSKIKEYIEESKKKNYSVISYIMEKKYTSMKYYASVFSLGTIFSDFDTDGKVILQYFLNFFELCLDSISHRFTYMLSKSTVTPDANLSIVFNAVLDFYNQCFSNYNQMIRKILLQTFLPYTLIYTGYSRGFLGVLGNDFEDTSDEYSNINLFIKIKKLDFAKIVFTSNNFPFYKFYELSKIDSINEHVNLRNLGEDYYNMILFYYGVIIKRYQKNPKINEKIIEMNNSKTPIEYCDKLMDLYFQFPEFSDNMEFELIFRAFTFINILHYSYGYQFLHLHYQLLDSIGLYDSDKLYSNCSLLSSGLYLFLKKTCKVIKFNLKIPENLKNKIEKTQIFENEQNNNERIDRFYSLYEDDLDKIGNLETENKKQETKEEPKEEPKEEKKEENKEDSKEGEEDEENDEKIKKYEAKFLKEIQEKDEKERLKKIKALIIKEHKKKHVFDTDDEYDQGQLELVEWYDNLIEGWGKIANDAKLLPAITRSDINKPLENSQKFIFFTRKPTDILLPTEKRNKVLNIFTLISNSLIDIRSIKGNDFKYGVDLFSLTKMINDERINPHISRFNVPINYFYFLCYLYNKDPIDFDSDEKCIWDLIQENDISWVPYFEKDL